MTYLRDLQYAEETIETLDRLLDEAYEDLGRNKHTMSFLWLGLAISSMINVFLALN